MSSIRRQINIAASPRTVWRMFTTDEGWCAWYADEARVDGRKGGRVVLTTEGDDGEPLVEAGFIHAWRPTARLEITWDSHGKAPSRGGRLSIQVARDGDETRLSVVISGGAAMEDPALREELDTTWRRALKGLRDTLEEE